MPEILVFFGHPDFGRPCRPRMILRRDQTAKTPRAPSKFKPIGRKISVPVFRDGYWRPLRPGGLSKLFSLRRRFVAIAVKRRDEAEHNRHPERHAGIKKKRFVLTDAVCVLAPEPGSSSVTATTSKSPKALVRRKKLMMMLFISGAASRKANSRPVVETKTSATVNTIYGTVCHRTLNRAPLRFAFAARPRRDTNPPPGTFRRHPPQRRAQFSDVRINAQSEQRHENHHDQRIHGLHLLRANVQAEDFGRHHFSPCNTQVELGLSNSDQNGVRPARKN